MPKQKIRIKLKSYDHKILDQAAQQIVEAFPWEAAQKYFLGYRDFLYGAYFRQYLKYIDITEVIIAS